MGCGCSKNKQVFKVIQASGEKTFDTYAKAQTEIRANGGRIRVTYESKTA